MGKRGNGEGSISRRKNGGWMGQYVVYTAEGRKRKTVYGKTRAEVAKKLNKALSDREDGLFFDAGNLKVGEYMDRWLRDSVEGNVGPRTLANYKLQVRRHIKPVLGEIQLKTLTPAHVQGLYRQKLDAGLAPSSVRYIHAVLHRALTQALRWGLVPRNVSEAVDLPKLVSEEVDALTPEEARKFLDAARGDRFEALYVVAVMTGMRRGELLGLRWSDIDLGQNAPATLRVGRQLQRMRDGSGLKFVAPKGGKGRTIRLPSRAVEALKAHRARQAEERLKAGPLYRDEGLVFASEVGTPLEPSNIDRRSFKPLLKKAGLPDIRFHDLRHTCATVLLSQGVNPKFVQELLGHADIKLTLGTYSHFLPSMGDQTANAMESALG
ncbi:phage integrase [Rubrobacter xylanophilus DSM 9941]|uniref:Phage integrase n=1 Tax=Rubrobacter xylanophilus (strain DSM 9941 / JCM 11954 / NBRC 16129 / PRD-1) TaxID=266117 RepID=Q1AUQ4_RUBXD|nr:site-specific integrase [Rubrobacter xylanophilus]ABG04874.1 phage integrase [Rubrobacter xylanophilus DSM 9941]